MVLLQVMQHPANYYWSKVGRTDLAANVLSRKGLWAKGKGREGEGGGAGTSTQYELICTSISLSQNQLDLQI